MLVCKVIIRDYYFEIILVLLSFGLFLFKSVGFGRQMAERFLQQSGAGLLIGWILLVLFWLKQTVLVWVGRGNSFGSTALGVLVVLKEDIFVFAFFANWRLLLLRLFYLLLNWTYFCAEVCVLNQDVISYTELIIYSSMYTLACLAERGFLKLKGVFLQVGFEAGQHVHPICCDLLFWLPRGAAHSLLLACWAQLGSHGAANCVDAITSCLSDVWSPLLSFFGRFLTIVARGFVFILEIIGAPVEALVAVLMATVEAKGCADASFRVLERVFG